MSSVPLVPGGLRRVTLILLRKERAILGDEGRDMEDAAESAPFLLGGGGGGGERAALEDRPQDGIPERARGGSEGGISLQPGELRLPLQCPGLARKLGPWHPLDTAARPEAREAEWVSEGGAGPGSDREVTDWRVKGCPTSSWVSTCAANP